MAGDGAENKLTPLDKDYAPVPVERLFSSLCAVKDIFEAIKVPYVLSGGTLLGAVREGDLIAGDTDWDIEILETHAGIILENAAMFEARGMRLEFPTTLELVSLSDGRTPVRVTGCEIIKVHDPALGFLGDLFVQTLFSDGILRRINRAAGAYFNPKMAFAYWFFENATTCRIRGQAFRCPAEPELMLERIYGPNWRIPLSRHTSVTGLNHAGAVVNARVEAYSRHAMMQGWVPRYADAPAWPHPVSCTYAGSSAWWIAAHEHPEIDPELVAKVSGLPLDQRNAAMVLILRAEITRLKARVRGSQRKRKALKRRLTAKRNALKPRGKIGMLLRRIEIWLSGGGRP